MRLAWTTLYVLLLFGISVHAEQYDSDEFDGASESETFHRPAATMATKSEPEQPPEDVVDPTYDDEDDYGGAFDEKQVTLLHSFDPEASAGAFEPRGKLTFQAPRGRPLAKSSKMLQMSVSSAPLEGAALAELRRLAEGDGLYRIAVSSNASDPTAARLIASVRACALLVSKFQERLVVHADSGGHFRSLVYSTPVAECTPSLKTSALQALPARATFLTKVKVMSDVEGLPVMVEPRTSRPLAPDGSPSPPRKQGEGEESQSFFRRYWYYIVPGVLVMMCMPKDDPPGREGGEEGQTGGRSGAAGSARRRPVASS